MTPRKHAELIKAWADGAEIQVFVHYAIGNGWVDDHNPTWAKTEIYRIKPVPKGDYIESGLIYFQSFNHCLSNIPVTVTFDGETGEAKKVEIVK